MGLPANFADPYMTSEISLERIYFEVDYCKEYGLVGQFSHKSLAIAKCSDPVSSMTRTALPGVPT